MANDRNRNRPPRDDPYDSLGNIHKDVHNLRKDIRDAIEKSQTAIMNRLSLIAAKIDGIGAGGISPEDKAALDALAVEGEAVTLKAERLNAER